MCCVALDAPDSAVSVPANALVDHVGKFEAKGLETLAAGFDDWCVRLYNGVSDGDKRKRWCDMFSVGGQDEEKHLNPNPIMRQVFLLYPYSTITCNRIQTDWEIQNVLSGHKKDLFAPNFFIFKRLHYCQYRISKNIEQMLQGRCLKKLIFSNDAMK